MFIYIYTPEEERLFGNSVVSPVFATMDEAEAHAYATLSSKGMKFLNESDGAGYFVEREEDVEPWENSQADKGAMILCKYFAPSGDCEDETSVMFYKLKTA